MVQFLRITISEAANHDDSNTSDSYEMRNMYRSKLKKTLYMTKELMFYFYSDNVCPLSGVLFNFSNMFKKLSVE